MANCRGCGKRIVWGEDEKGRKIPLDPSPPVYEIWQEPEARLPRDGKRIVRRRTDCMVSHFATCPKANDFSGSRKKKGAGFPITEMRTKNPEAGSVVIAFLRDNGYDGLYNLDDECGCGIGDLAPCGGPLDSCRAGHKIPAPDGSSGIWYGPKKEGD